MASDVDFAKPTVESEIEIAGMSAVDGGESARWGGVQVPGPSTFRPRGLIRHYGCPNGPVTTDRESGDLSPGERSLNNGS